MREKANRGGGENGRRVALGWSRRFLKSKWRREEAKPWFSSWKAREGFRQGSD